MTKVTERELQLKNVYAGRIVKVFETYDFGNKQERESFKKCFIHDDMEVVKNVFKSFKDGHAEEWQEIKDLILELSEELGNDKVVQEKRVAEKVAVESKKSYAGRKLAKFGIEKGEEINVDMAMALCNIGEGIIRMYVPEAPRFVSILRGITSDMFLVYSPTKMDKEGNVTKWGNYADFKFVKHEDKLAIRLVSEDEQGKEFETGEEMEVKLYKVA